MAKGDKFSLKQCPKNDFEEKKMQKVPYASVVGSLMYAKFVRVRTLHTLLGYWVGI